LINLNAPEVVEGAIHMEHLYPAPASKVFEAMMDDKQMAFWTNIPQTIIMPVEGGRFWTFGGRVLGRIIELVKDRRLVQAWRSFDWPKGLYSMVRIELVPQGAQTLVIFEMLNFPERQRAHIEDAWKTLYWVPLGRYLSGQAVQQAGLDAYWQEG
jgi:uncharacterized protein YndB with AHSA1/START domain